METKLGVKGRTLTWERSGGWGKEGQTKEDQGKNERKAKDMGPMWKGVMTFHYL